MIETVMTAQMPVGLPIKIKKNRLEPDYIREDMPRLSIVAGVHGDELQGQYICYELIRRIKEEREHLRGIVDIISLCDPDGTGDKKAECSGCIRYECNVSGQPSWSYDRIYGGRSRCRFNGIRFLH